MTMRDEPSETITCDECGGEGTWEPIVWDFDDGDESLDVARSGYGSYCSQCGLLQEISMGEWTQEFELTPPSKDRTIAEVTMSEMESGEEVVVILDVDEETISDEGLVFCGEVFIADELPSLEGESVWVDLDAGVVRLGSEDGTVVGADAIPGVSEAEG